MPTIESIPNVSEGRRADVVEAIADAVRAVPGVRLLDYSSDASHNRSVFTLAGDAGALKAATLALFQASVAAIDLRQHQGEHPRLGAVDVVPFVPIEGVTMKRRRVRCGATWRTSGAASSRGSREKWRSHNGPRTSGRLRHTHQPARRSSAPGCP